MTPYLASHGVRDASQPDTQTRSTYQPASRLAQPDGAHRTAVELRCPVKTGHQQGARCAEDLEALAPGCVSRTDHAATRAPSSQSHISPSELPLEVAKGCELGGNLGAIAPMMNATEKRVTCTPDPVLPQPDLQTRNTDQLTSKLAKPDGAQRTAVELSYPAKTGRQRGARCAEDLEALAPGCVSRTDHANSQPGR